MVPELVITLECPVLRHQRRDVARRVPLLQGSLHVAREISIADRILQIVRVRAMGRLVERNAWWLVTRPQGCQSGGRDLTHEQFLSRNWIDAAARCALAARASLVKWAECSIRLHMQRLASGPIDAATR